MSAVGHPVGHPVSRAVSYAAGLHSTVSGTDAAPKFKVLGPGVNGEISTAVLKGTGSATFTRADGATDIAHVRDFENLYKKVPAGEARFQGARRVRNELTYSEDLSNAVWTKQTGVTISDKGDGIYEIDFSGAAVDLGVYQLISYSGATGHSVTHSAEIRVLSGTGTIHLTDPAGGAVDTEVSLNTSWQRFANEGYTPLAASIGIWFKRASGDATVIQVRKSQVEIVTGQTNQAPSEYVATSGSAVTKYFYTENNNEVVENQLPYSNDLTQWTQTGTAVSSYDSDTGYTTLTDDDGTAYEDVRKTVTISDDSLTNAVFFDVTKDSDETRFPEFQIAYSGGTAQNIYSQLNTATGDIVDRNITGTGSSLVEDHGSFWRVFLFLANNGSGNTSALVKVLPASATVFGTPSSAATGSCVIQGTQLMFDQSNTVETLIETTGTAITNVVGTKTAQWEQVDNQLPYSSDLTQWTQSGTDVSSYSNGVSTLTDDNASGYENVSEDVTISDDSATHCASVKILKDNDETRFPEVTFRLTGGTSQVISSHLNTKTGATAQVAKTGNGSFWVEDADDYWILHSEVANNSSGNTTARLTIGPATGTVIGSNNVAAVGSITVSYASISLNRTIPYSGLVTTTGSAITLGKNVGLRDQLHPIGIKQNASYFKRFNKWVTATAYSVGDNIIPATGSGPAGGNGYYYQCIVAGTTGGSEPTFGTTIGDGTYDNGVVWKCMGKATVAGYLSEPSRTNSITDSYDLTAWTQTGTSVSALDAVGIDGVANHATTLTDDDGAAHEYVSTTATIANDSNTHVVSVMFKKDADTSRFPSVDLVLSGGTSQYIGEDINTSTGVSATRTSVGTVSSWVEDHGDWWKLILTVANNSTGNTTATVTVYASVGTTIGVSNVAATGSCIVGHVQLELNTDVPSSPILTTGAADTRAADVLYYSDQSILNNSSIVLSVINVNQESVVGFFDSRADSNNGVDMYNSGGTIYFRKTIAGSSKISSQALSPSRMQNYKIAERISSVDGVDSWIDASAGTNDTDVNDTTSGPIYIGCNLVGGIQNSSCTTDVIVYNVALADSKMATISGLD